MKWSRVGSGAVAFSGVALVAAACGGGAAKSSQDSEADASSGGSSSGASSSTSSSSRGQNGSSDGGNGNAGDAQSGTLDGTAPLDAGPIVAPQPLSPFIVVDQFGYRPGTEKVAVLRSPVTGFDSSTSFTPGPTVALVEAHGSNTKVLEASPVAWNGGATDVSSGDRAWRFDFSSVDTPGDYYVLDEKNGVRSDVFTIASNVFAPILQQAVRMLYYQRDGTAKPAQYAGAAWADTIEHPQDAQCVTYDTATSPRDLHGGWFDAGDENRYSNWGATDVIDLLRAYREAPNAFADDYGIPESGNGIPDLLDEAKWELDWLLRMQSTHGGVLSIAGHVGASPPSADTSPCRYGPESTSASYSGAAVFAFASVVFQPFDATYAATLKAAAISAWTWAQANPNVVFMNSNLVGAGEQELDSAYGLPMRELEAALYMFEATGSTTYQQYFDANYQQAHMFTYGNYADMFEAETQDTLLDYTLAKGATSSVVKAIQAAYLAGMGSAHNLAAVQGDADPYLSYMYTYTWGSNQDRSAQGSMFYNLASYGVDAAGAATDRKYAERYVHYLHGTNPLGLAYLSNMASYGAVDSVTCFFHTWFAHDSALWSKVGAGVSTYGPPPGYLPGGPNPGYTIDACCSSSSNSCSTQAGCSANVSPPAGQPSQKSYAQFNDNWPIDSWQVTEPDDGYQAAYIRLLSKFLP